MNYLAMGPFCWGKGATIEEAIKNAKMNWISSYTGIKRPQPKHFSVWESEGEFTVDGMGQVTSTKPITKLQTSTLAAD